jgi:hypothetical protein
MLYVMACLLERFDVIDVEQVVVVVVLEHHVLALDQGLLAARVDRVLRGAEVQVDRVVAEAVRGPVEGHAQAVLVARQHLDVVDRVAGARVGRGRARAVGLDAEHAVFQALAGRVVDQRDLVARVGGEAVVVVPRRHVELDVGRVELEPVGPALLVERAGLGVEKGSQGFVAQHDSTP